MDPIHPIVPVTPNILPILPTPMVGQVDRDGAQDRPDNRRRQHRGTPSRETSADRGEGLVEPDGEPPSVGEDDDGLGHVDLTA
jgi:hypothetical protein